MFLDRTILECLDLDELKSLLSSHPVLKKFEEQKISFNPTYKYDKNSEKYDSSKKLRKPAWTDRILISRSSRLTGDLKPMDYFADHKFQLSDHRPVFGLFSLQVNLIFFADFRPKFRFFDQICFFL